MTQTAPDVTGAIGKAGAPDRHGSGEQTAPSISTNDLVPFYLPDVPRARMRACGETWHNRKMAGDTGDDDWRDFAIKCLASSTPPS